MKEINTRRIFVEKWEEVSQEDKTVNKVSFSDNFMDDVIMPAMIEACHKAVDAFVKLNDGNFRADFTALKNAKEVKEKIVDKMSWEEEK